jgi:hypothetical protein
VRSRFPPAATRENRVARAGGGFGITADLSCLAYDYGTPRRGKLIAHRRCNGIGYSRPILWLYGVYIAAKLAARTEKREGQNPGRRQRIATENSVRSLRPEGSLRSEFRWRPIRTKVRTLAG